MYSAQGNLAVRADVDAKGSGHVGVLAEDGSQGLLGINSSGSGSEMLLAGPTAKVTVNLSSTEGLEMYSQTERAPVVGLYFKERGGKLVIADNAGTIMLEGGITESGRGIFFAGPRIGGGIPATGLPFAIEGQK